MLRVSSSDKLDELTGARRLAPVAVAAPVDRPRTPEPAAPSFDKLEHAVLALAAQQRDNNQAVLELARRPKQLEAEIVRDDKGRMSKVIITVTERT